MKLSKYYNSLFEPGCDAPAETISRIIKQPFFGRSNFIMSRYFHSHIYTAIGSPEFVRMATDIVINDVVELDRRIRNG